MPDISFNSPNPRVGSQKHGLLALLAGNLRRIVQSLQRDYQPDPTPDMSDIAFTTTAPQEGASEHELLALAAYNARQVEQLANQGIGVVPTTPPRLWVRESSGTITARMPFNANYDFELSISKSGGSNGQTQLGTGSLIPASNGIGDVTGALTLVNGGDDFGPIACNGKNHVGGNHGFLVTKIQSTSHGRTSGDIGKRYQDANSRLFRIAQIVDADNFLVAVQPFSYSTVSDWTDPAVGPSGTLTGLDGQPDISTYTKSSVQLTGYGVSSIKNRTVQVLVDGRPLMDNETIECEVLEIAEQYDIWHLSQAYDKFGSGGSWLDCDPWLRRNLNYRLFGNCQLTVEQTVKVILDTPDQPEFRCSYSGQFNQITTLGGIGYGNRWAAVLDVIEKTVGSETRDWNSPQLINSFLTDQWLFQHPNDSLNANVPPWLGLEWASSSSGSLTPSNFYAGMAVFYDLDWQYGQPSVRKDQMYLSATYGAWRLRNGTNKMYPNDFAMGKKPAGTVLSVRLHRVWFPSDASGLSSVFFARAQGYWLMVAVFLAQTGTFTVTLPDHIAGRTPSEVLTRNGTWTARATEIDVAASGTGYVVLRFD